MNNNETKVCSICGRKYIGFGNNAWPIKTGECCDSCDLNIVIPARIQTILRDEEEGN